MRRAAMAFAALGVLAIAACGLLVSGFPQALGSASVIAAATAALIVGVLWHRPAHPGPWWVLVASMLAGSAGNVLHVASYGAVLPDPLLAAHRLLAVSAVVLVVAAALLFLAARRPGQDRDGLLDALMVLAGVALVVLAAPVWLPQHPDRLIPALSAALMVATLVMVVRLLIGASSLPPSMAALIASLGLAAAGSLMAALGGAEPASPVYLSAPAGLAAVLVGAAALHPSMVSVAEPEPVPERRVTPARLVALGAALLINPVVAFRASGTPGTSPLLAVGLAVLTVLVLWRIGRLLLQRERMQAALLRSEVRLQALVQHAFDAILVLSPEGVIRYASPALGRMLGRADADFSDADAADLLVAEDAAALRTALQTLRYGGEPTRIEVRLRRADGTTMWGELSLVNRHEDPAVGGIVGNLRDTTSRKHAETELQHLALHDPLTGLPNRAALMRSLEDGLRYDTRRFDGLAVLFVDLDGFKAVNDRYGHAIGDRLLVGVADRLRSAVRPYDTVGRFGGDEFVVVATGIASDPQALVVAERLRAYLRPPFVWPGLEVRVSCTIGVARTDRSDMPAEQLISVADQAMYRARDEGRQMSVEWLTTPDPRLPTLTVSVPPVGS